MANNGFSVGEMDPVEAEYFHGNTLPTSKSVHVKEELGEDSPSEDGEYHDACVVQNSCL